MATLSTMQSNFELYLAETTSSSDFITAAQEITLLNEACRVFAVQTKIIRPATPISCTLVASTKGYDLISGFIAVTYGVFLYNASSTYQNEIEPQEEGFRGMILEDSTAACPERYVIEGYTKATAAAEPVPQIQFDPTPATAYANYVAKVYYARTPAVTLAAATDVSDIPVPFHDGIPYLACALFKERDQELEQAQYYWKRANWWISEAKKYLHYRDKTLTGWRFPEGQYVNR